jgi:hypothetical protein
MQATTAEVVEHSVNLERLTRYVYAAYLHRERNANTLFASTLNRWLGAHA